MLHGTTDGSGVGSDMEHLDLSNPTSSTSSNSLQRPKKTGLGGAQPPPLFVLIFVVLPYFSLFYFDFTNFSSHIFSNFLLIFVFRLIFIFLHFFLTFYLFIFAVLIKFAAGAHPENFANCEFS